MSREQPARDHKFHLLDALRGVAAMAVVVGHNGIYFAPLTTPHYYLAVDFFFCLSGFVLAYAYQQRIDAGMPPIRWMSIRVIRLYPVYLAGLLLGIASVFSGAHPDLRSESFRQLAAMCGLNLALLPAATYYLFPFDPPGWSLFFELVANIFHRLFYRNASPMRLYGVIAASASLLAVSAVENGSTHFGWNSHHFLLGVPRVLLSYTIGCLLARFWSEKRWRWRASPLVPAIALLVALALPSIGGYGGVLYELVWICFLFPGIVLVGAQAEVRGKTVAIAAAFGTLSYPIYVLHWPCYLLLSQLWKEVFKHSAEVNAPWSGLAMFFIVVAISFAAASVDLPVRKWISRRVLH